MKSIDEKIKQALSDEFNDIVTENENTDANPFKQMKLGFTGKMKWIYIQVMFFTTLFFAGMVYSIYRFYYEQEIKSLIAWAIAIVIFGLVAQISKLWYWSEMGRNRVIREIKLLELQVALLTDKIKKH